MVRTCPQKRRCPAIRGGADLWAREL